MAGAVWWKWSVGGDGCDGSDWKNRHVLRKKRGKKRIGMEEVEELQKMEMEEEAKKGRGTEGEKKKKRTITGCGRVEKGSTEKGGDCRGGMGKRGA